MWQGYLLTHLQFLLSRRLPRTHTGGWYLDTRRPSSSCIRRATAAHACGFRHTLTVHDRDVSSSALRIHPPTPIWHFLPCCWRVSTESRGGWSRLRRLTRISTNWKVTKERAFS